MDEREIRKHFIIVIAFLAFTAVFWRRLFFGGLIPFDVDTLCFYFPNWAIGRRLLSHGHLLWDPYRNFGQSFIGVPQAQALYPPRLFSPLLSFDAYTRLSVAFHTALAAGFAYFLARRRGASDAGACATALGFAFAGAFFMRVVFAADFATIAWLPCVLYFLASRRPALMAMAMALQWFAGYPPLFIVSLAIVAAYIATQEDARGAWRTFALAAPLAAAIAAAQAVPFLEMLRLSSRDVLLSSQEAMTNSTHPMHLLRGLLLPSLLHDVYPTPIYFRPMFYLGPIVTALAIFAAWRGGRPERRLFAASAVFFFLSLGHYNGVTERVGVANLFRYQGNWTLGGTACLALLAGAGVSFLPVRWQWAASALIALDLLAFAWPARHPAGDATFVTSVTDRLDGLRDHPEGRLLHTEEVLKRYGDWNWSSPLSWPLLKRVLLPSYGTAFGLREGASHHNLTSRTAQDLRRRLNYAALDAELFAVADIDRVVTLTADGAASRLPRDDQFPVIHNRKHHGRAFVIDASTRPATVREDAPGRLTAWAMGPGRFVYSEGTAPGWRAQVDGRDTAVEIFADALMSIPLARGEHEVAFTYRPLSFFIGVIISVAGLIATLGLWLRERRRLSLAADQGADLLEL